MLHIEMTQHPARAHSYRTQGIKQPFGDIQNGSVLNLVLKSTEQQFLCSDFSFTTPNYIDTGGPPPSNSTHLLHSVSQLFPNKLIPCDALTSLNCTANNTTALCRGS